MRQRSFCIVYWPTNLHYNQRRATLFCQNMLLRRGYAYYWHLQYDLSAKRLLNILNKNYHITHRVVQGVNFRQKKLSSFAPHRAFVSHGPYRGMNHCCSSFTLLYLPGIPRVRPFSSSVGLEKARPLTHRELPRLLRLQLAASAVLLVTDVNVTSPIFGR